MKQNLFLLTFRINYFKDVSINILQDILLDFSKKRKVQLKIKTSKSKNHRKYDFIIIHSNIYIYIEKNSLK